MFNSLSFPAPLLPIHQNDVTPLAPGLETCTLLSCGKLANGEVAPLLYLISPPPPIHALTTQLCFKEREGKGKKS